MPNTKISPRGSQSATTRLYQLKNGDRLAYEWLGHGKTKAFFFHGFPGSRHQGRLVERYCDEFDLQIATFDRPGYGESVFRQLPLGYTGLADVLEEVATGWGWEQVHLLSVSGGTPYAMAWAARSPRVASLHTVCGLGPLSDEAFRSEFSPSFIKMMKTAHLTPEFALNVLLKAAQRGGERASIAGHDVSSFLMHSSMKEAFRQGARGAKLDLANYLVARDIEWSAIRCPTKIWHGTSDSVVPSSFAERFKGLIPHADLRIKMRENHYSLPYQHARAILAEVQGLAKAHAS